jgi:hypothetical protein
MTLNFLFGRLRRVGLVLALGGALGLASLRRRWER